MNLKKRESITAYIFALPSIIGFLLFFYIPFIISLVYCFTQGVGDIEYVGFQNFVDLFQNDAFILAFKNTLIFNAVSVPLVMIISLGITLILNSKIKKGSFF